MTKPGDNEIDLLIRALSGAKMACDAFNQYAPDDRNNAIRRANLRLYLRALAARRPKALLVMEAPGYRGCRLTGIPVTSRKVLLEGVPALDMFGQDAGYRNVEDVGFERFYGEQSATIVWNALSDFGALPFIWNAFPFHPHQAGKGDSNRRPRAAELILGTEFLGRMLAIWDFEQVIAVGNVAYETMQYLNLDCQKVRHPARGGKHDFVAGLADLLSVGA